MYCWVYVSMSTIWNIQKRFCVEFMPPLTIKPTFSCKMPIFLLHCIQIFSSQIFIEISNIKFHENVSSGRYADTCGQTERHDEGNGHFPRLVTQFYMPDCSVTEVALVFKIMFFINDVSHTFCLLQGSMTKRVALSVSRPIGLRGPMYIHFGHCLRIQQALHVFNSGHCAFIWCTD
jgi:hypothetical protein